MTCTFMFNTNRAFVDEVEIPSKYKYEILECREERTDNLKALIVIYAEELSKVIDNEDSVPEIGLVSYKDDILDLKDVSIREVFKKILEMEKIFTK
ncbi:MAG: hypothetical protein ACRC3Y_11950 [Romboutsia sp.]|uniref:hypothetical protein n=1 Tax=Romboutsia sp. TaxID=1965302 RepID=UPI003F2C780C